MKTIGNHKFLGIQALRMVAAVMVVCTHSTYYAHERLDNKFAVWTQGARGVDLFFVISGFVMIYASRKLFGALGGWREFAEHRIVRIVPLYWLLTSIKVLVLLLTVGFSLHAKLSWATVVCSYFFLPTKNVDGRIEPLVGVGWTLTFEMFFYFLFALALLLRLNVFKFIGVILAILAIGAYFRQPSWPTVAFYLNPIVLEFFFGMIIAKACMKGIYCPRKAIPWVLVLGFICLFLPSSPKSVVSGLFASVIVWSAASLGSLEHWIPRVVLYLGDASYSIYLIHPFVSPLPPNVLNRLNIGWPWFSVAVSIACGIGLGCILHQSIELPLTRWLKGHLRVHQKARELNAGPEMAV